MNLKVAYEAIASIVPRVIFHQPVERVDLDTVRELLEGVLPQHHITLALRAPWLVGITIIAPDGITIYSRNLFAS
jgi:hypothetical protein